jgi:uncharacterized protein
VNDAVKKSEHDPVYTRPMKPTIFSPYALDIAPFAQTRGALQGIWPPDALPRLAASMSSSHAMADQSISWSIRGDQRSGSGTEPRCWLSLSVQAPAVLVCQRCLGALELSLSVQREVMFVSTEAQAEQLDAEMEDDVLVLSKDLNVQTLMEDELLLALPLVPRHPTCPEPIILSTPQILAPAAPHPFAALAALKKH